MPSEYGASYSKLAVLDGNISPIASSTNGVQAQSLFSFNIIEILTRKFGSAIWQGKTLLADKITIAQGYISKMIFNWWGYGTKPGGNKASISFWNGGSWTLWSSTSSATVAKLNITSTGLNPYIDSNGFLHFLAYTDPSDGVTGSTLYTDYVELIITTNPINVTEWVPMGTFYLDAWKNDVGAVTVTLIAHDNFTMLDNISYGDVGVDVNKTLYDIAVAVFQAAGITDYNIDQSLKNYTTTTGFKEKVTCRVALQHIGMAGMSAVYQDRHGTMQIKPFSSIDSASNYVTYTGSGLYAGFDPFDIGAFAKINDGNGMKRLDLNNMYTVPEITLDKSIYQLIVKVYSSTSTSTDYTKINTDIAGQNGESFTIDNPLINTTVLAQAVANWFILESNFNVVYKANWRGNPILEGADIVIISNGLDFIYAKQGRIYKQEFQYEGYLTCQTESRGGV